MALQNFIRTVWIVAIQRALQKAHVFAQFANTDYQGEMKNLFDTVRVMMIGDVAAKNYTANQDIASPDDLEDAVRILTADQALYFNVKVNDVEAVQQKQSLLNEAASRAAYAFSNAVDTYFAGLYAQAGIPIYSTGTTPYTVTSLNVEDVLLAISEKMTKANIPKENRFVVIPAWMETKLVLAGLKVKTQNDDLYANGNLGRILNFEIAVSNNISMTDATAETGCKIIAGVKRQSLSFAGVINKIEAYRPEKRFEDAIKGLYVFGGKIMRPDMTAVAYCDKGVS